MLNHQQVCLKYVSQTDMRVFLKWERILKVKLAMVQNCPAPVIIAPTKILFYLSNNTYILEDFNLTQGAVHRNKLSTSVVHISTFGVQLGF